MKDLKNKISSDSTFRSNDYITIDYLNNGKALFLKFWYLYHPSNYKATALPGNKKGVSGSIVIGNNIGISRYISEESKRASIEVLKFFLSKETQKEYIIKNYLFSGIESLYR